MCVPVVNVRKVRVAVTHYRVLMGMIVRLRTVPREVVRMLVMIVVHMVVVVIHWLMQMFVSVTFGQVQPHPERHQCGCYPECG